jgi:hypothetical protein
VCCLWCSYGRGAGEVQYYITKRGIIFTLYLVEVKRILTLSVSVQLSVYSQLKHTICTTMSDTLTFSFVLYVHGISEQRAVSFLYSIKSLAFMTETEWVYCAVRTGSLNIIQINIVL